MPEQVIEVEADSLEEARAKVRAQTPPGWFVQSEQIVADGRPTTCRAVADTTEEAFAKAGTDVPPGTIGTERKEVCAPSRKTLTVEALDEPTARSQVREQLTDEMRLETFTLSREGVKGFLGIGRKPNTYSAEIFQPAVVEIVYRQRARVIAKVSDRMADWAGLISVIQRLKAADDTLTMAKAFPLPLIEQYPHQVLFILSRMEFDPRRYEGVPFGPVSSRTVEKSRHYANTTRLPGMLGLMGDLEPDRYTVRADGSVARKCNLGVDMGIVQVAGCLPRVTINALDGAAVGRYAFDAISHYKDIPIVRYFCSLAYFEKVLATKEVSSKEALEMLYKGVESLLIELYDELGEGETITDDRLARKVRSMF